MRISSRHTSTLFLGLVVSFWFFSFPHAVGAESTSSLCGPIVWATSDVPAGASNSNVLNGSTSTIYWSVPYEDRSIQTTIKSFKALGEAQAWASKTPGENEEHHWQSMGGYGGAAVYFRETANGNQYMVQGLHGGYNFVTVSTTSVFGTMPTLWTVPPEIHTALFDQALSMITAKCGSGGEGVAEIFAEPNLLPDTETAIIPADQRFPGRYSVTIRRSDGKPAPDHAFQVQVGNSSIARLDGNGQSGSRIELTTDTSGRAVFTYTYLGNPPKGTMEDIITLRSDPLKINKPLKVSIGLSIELAEVQEVWDADVNMPETLGMLLVLRDEFRPEMDLFQYVLDLQQISGLELGVHVSTLWLNRPDPSFFENLQTYVQGFQPLPDNVLYNGPALISKAGDKTITAACRSPNRSSGEHSLPAIILNGEGTHVIHVSVNPIVIEDCSNNQLDPVSAYSHSNWRIFAATTFESEHWFKSMACSFKPTTKQQFIAKKLFLDNPFFTDELYMGAGVATPVGWVLGAAKGLDFICDVMSGDYVSAFGTMASEFSDKVKGDIDDLIKDGALELTEREATLYALNHAAKFTYDAQSGALTAWDLFIEQQAASVREVASTDTGPLFSSWPTDLGADEFSRVLLEMTSGILTSPAFEGYQMIAIVNGTTPSYKDSQGLPLSGDFVSYGKGNIHVAVLPASTGQLTVGAGSTPLSIVRYESRGQGVVSASTYSISPQGGAASVTLDLSGPDGVACGVDQGLNGSVDTHVQPETTVASGLLSLPTGTGVFSFPASISPVRGTYAPYVQPIGLGDAAVGGPMLDLSVGIPACSGPVDLYVAIYMPKLDNVNIYLLTSDTRLQSHIQGIVPWRTGIRGPILENVFSGIPVSALSGGEPYYFYLALTPSGAGLNQSYIWVTNLSH